MEALNSSNDTIEADEQKVKTNQKGASLTPVGDYTSPDQVEWNVGENDPGSFFQLKDDNAIHAAIAGASTNSLPVGLTLGATPADSSTNLRNW